MREVDQWGGGESSRSQDRCAVLNWAGFYFRKGDVLVLGPFQGQLACTRIALGRDVCGTAAAAARTVVVEDVHEFPGPIACDGASNSEIVAPLLQNGRVVGVLDLDSPKFARFDAEDRAWLEPLVREFIERAELPSRNSRPAVRPSWIRLTPATT